MSNDRVPAAAGGMPALTRREALRSLAAGSAVGALGAGVVFAVEPAGANAAPSPMAALIAEHREKFAIYKAAVIAWDTATAAYNRSLEDRPIALPAGARLEMIEMFGAEAEITRIRRLCWVATPEKEAMVRAAAPAMAARDAEFRCTELDKVQLAAGNVEGECLDRLLSCRPASLAEATDRFAYLVDEHQLEELEEFQFRLLAGSFTKEGVSLEEALRLSDKRQAPGRP